jgi:vacuole morphology and inheritance protein 14
VRVATEAILAEFLREIRDVTLVRRRFEEQAKARKEKEIVEQTRRPENAQSKLLDIPPERAVFIPENDASPNQESDGTPNEDFVSETDYRDTASKSGTCYVLKLTD